MGAPFPITVNLRRGEQASWRDLFSDSWGKRPRDASSWISDALPTAERARDGNCGVAAMWRYMGFGALREHSSTILSLLKPPHSHTAHWQEAQAGCCRLQGSPPFIP